MLHRAARNFRRIQAAIDDVGCATIHVSAGVYRETLTVSRPVSIVATAPIGQVILDGENARRLLVVPMIQHQSDIVYIFGFVFRNGRSQTSAGDPGHGGAVTVKGRLIVFDSVFIGNQSASGRGDHIYAQKTSSNGIPVIFQAVNSTFSVASGCSIASEGQLALYQVSLNGGGNGLCTNDAEEVDWSVNVSTFSNFAIAINLGSYADSGTLNVTNSTFAKNRQSIVSLRPFSQMQLAIGNTILQKLESSPELNCGLGTGSGMVSLGKVIESDGSCRLSNPSDAALDPEGPTTAVGLSGVEHHVFRLGFASPARFAGDQQLCGNSSAVDQLGRGRTVCSIGAIETGLSGLTLVDMFEDTNRNGVADNGEQRLEWPLKVFYRGPGASALFADSATGGRLFRNPDGTYILNVSSIAYLDLCVEPQSGWSVVTSQSLVDERICLINERFTDAAPRGDTFRFGFTRVQQPTLTPTPVPPGAAIRVRNTDANGAPISDLTARVDIYANGTAPTLATDASGIAQFNAVAAGNVRACMIKPVNRTAVRPQQFDSNGNPCYWYTLANGSDVTLAFEWSAVIGGPTATPQPPPTATSQPGGASFVANVFNDANGNGSRDSGEAALSGWRVTAFDQANNDAVARTGTTDANGNVTLSGLASGSYRICEDLQSGWANTRPTAKDGAGRPCYWFSIQNGQTQNVAFGNRNTGAPADPDAGRHSYAEPERQRALQRSQVQRRNAKGAEDSGEAGLANWNFVAINSNTGRANPSHKQRIRRDDAQRRRRQLSHLRGQPDQLAQHSAKRY